MSIQADAIDAYYAHQAAVSGQQRLEFGQTANRVALKHQGRRERMLARLREGGPATTLEMMMLGGAGFSSRLHELRVAGHRITCEEHEDGAVYTLVRS